MEGQQMIAVKEDIESIKATLASIKSLVDSAAEVMADGKVDFRDVTLIPEIYSKVKYLVDAVKGVGSEVKDLDPAEMKEVLLETLDLVVYVAQKLGVKV